MMILLLILMQASFGVSAEDTIAAQPVEPAKTLHLDSLRAAAVRQDPRAVQPDLLARATRLRLASLRAQRVPQLSLSGQATLQNEVPDVPLNLPGQAVPRPPHEQYRLQLEADWTVYDGGRIRRQTAAEQARMDEEVAGVAVTLYALREAATETFFSALLSEATARTLRLSAEDVEARLRIARRQVEEGTALAADAAALEAELIRMGQRIDEAEAVRSAALAVLAELTGLALSPSDSLALPNLDADVSRTLRLIEGGERVDVSSQLIGRPELIRLAYAAERANAEALALEASTRPSLSVFGQGGLGRPSPFNFFSDDLSEYGLAGVRLSWSLFDGDRARREAEALRVQARLAETEAEAFARQIRRQIEHELAHLVRLNAALTDDERAIELREEALRAARRQLDEGVLLPDLYTDRLTDLAEARLRLERHRIERAQVQAGLLSALGRYPEPGLSPASEAHPRFE